MVVCSVTMHSAEVLFALYLSSSVSSHVTLLFNNNRVIEHPISFGLKALYNSTRTIMTVTTKHVKVHFSSTVTNSNDSK